MSQKRLRTTINIPIELIERIDDVVDRKIAPSRNALLIQALQHYLKHLEQQQIDEQIAQMKDDLEYKNLHLEMVQEYETAGWEALHLSEEDS